MKMKFSEIHTRTWDDALCRMEWQGGYFVQALAKSFRGGDVFTRRRLLTAFGHHFKEYLPEWEVVRDWERI